MTWCNVGPNVLSAADAPYTVSASYRGSTDVAPSSASLIQSVAKAASLIRIHSARVVSSGDSIVIRVAVKGLRGTAGMATGTVTFTIAGASGASLFCIGGDTVGLVFGKVICDTTEVDAAVSPYVVTATYSGDGTFNGSTSSPRTIGVS